MKRARDLAFSGLAWQGLAGENVRWYGSPGITNAFPANRAIDTHAGVLVQ
jgi:hypothetical protein